MRSILEKRLKYFDEINPREIYRMYHSNSEFRNMFKKESEYIEYFDELIRKIKPIEVTIYKENIYSNNDMKKKLKHADNYTLSHYDFREDVDDEIAEIVFLEKAILLETKEVIDLYTVTILKKENNEWKIFKDIRDK